MPRYPEWFKKVGDTAAHPKALDVGKKLLGYLAIRRETPGVQTLVQRVTLDDGTTVEASFAGDQPQVIVYSPDGKDACELYVESGLLDLGPNIAGDADKRFNRGPPEFGDTPATLYFGDGVDCKQGEAGLNGKVRVNPRAKTLASECLPTQGKIVQSRLRDPKKKQAQAMLPASCWSGLMQRYVQAVYGGDALSYAATSKSLIIDGFVISVAASIGLIASNGTLRFVVFDPTSGGMDVYACRPTSHCFAACIGLWRSMPDRDIKSKQKVLSIALSGCKVGKHIERVETGIAGNTFFAGRSAMHFSADGARAAVVVESGGTATAYALTFTIKDGALSVATSSVGSGRVITDPEAWPMRVSATASAFSGNKISEPGFQDGDPLSDGSRFDYPVYALCTSDGMDVVRYSLLVSDDVAVEADDCVDVDIRPTNFGPESPCSSDLHSFKKVVSGYYCTGDSGVRWSVVEQTAIAKGKDGISTNIRGTKTKALAIVPIGDEWQETHPTDGFIPEAVWVMGSAGVRPVADGDCLFTGGEYPHRILTATHNFSAPPATCDVIRGTVFGACVGATGGTGFPPYISEATCDFEYVLGGYSSTCNMITRFQDAKVYALWLVGDLLSPTPHAISMCSGSYDFVTDRHAVTSFKGTYVSKQDDWRDGDSRYVCDFSGTLYKSNSMYPGSLCDGVGLAPVYHDDLSGHYETEFTGRKLTRETTFNEWIHRDDINRLAKQLARGSEVYKSISSYGTNVYVSGSFSRNAGDDSPEEYSVYGDKEIIKACSFTKHLFIGEVADDPIETETAASKGDKVRWARNAPDHVGAMLDGFTYACSNSLVGASITHTLQIDRGYSINMDRQSITGGYPKVSTPSFVGWA